VVVIDGQLIIGRAKLNTHGDVGQHHVEGAVAGGFAQVTISVVQGRPLLTTLTLIHDSFLEVFPAVVADRREFI
jgi:hypothetical protein